MTTPRSSRRPLATLLLSGVLAVAPAVGAGATVDDPALVGEQRVYDLTGRSLDEAQLAEVRDAVDRVVAAGADPVVVVRALDATPEETLDQVEQLQEAWVGSTGAARDTAVAVLVNRNPDDDGDARAGIFVGATYDEGNVPRGEQEAIVAEELIPPLRDGDVTAALVGALTRLASSIRSGPPRSGLEVAAADVAGGWVPWLLLALAGAGAVVLARVGRRGERLDLAAAPATTTRPSQLQPALGAALAHGRARPTAVTATLLDLARRGALVLLPEDDGGSWRSSPSVAARLWSDGPVTGPVERVLWDELTSRADEGLVPGDDLRAIVSSPAPVLDAVTDELDERRWRDVEASGRVGTAVAVTVASVLLLVATLVLVAASGDPWPLVVVSAAAAVVGVAGVVVASSTPRLTGAGQRAARPWLGYREGLRVAADEDPPAVDLGATLPDLVAMGLVDRCREHLERDASALVDYVSLDDGATLAGFPWWVAVVGTTTPPSAAGGTGVVSGGGVAGGGGAAGST